MRYLDQLRTRIFHDVVNGQKVYGGGLLRDKPDQRDFQVGSILSFLGIAPYKPLHTEHRIDTITYKNQGPTNTCGWFSYAVGAQAREKTRLSATALIKIARRENKLSGNGFSSLRDNMLVGNKFGIPSEDYLPDLDITQSWEEFSKNDLTPVINENAYKHRSDSYWSVNGRDQILKMLDENKTLHTGSDWYNEYNMRGGFKAPWIITGPGSIKVGGHAFQGVGYDLTGKRYSGELVRIQNSYGPYYGDGGDFYVPMAIAIKMFYSFWVELDLPVDISQFLIANNNSNVRARGQRGVYLIRDGKKSSYVDWLTFLAFGGIKSEIKVVDPVQLDAIPEGEEMDITQSDYWDIIKQMAAPDNYKKLLELTRSTSASYSLGFASLDVPVTMSLAETLMEIYDEMNHK